jgi:hypothetical protein
MLETPLPDIVESCNFVHVIVPLMRRFYQKFSSKYQGIKELKIKNKKNIGI